MAIRRTIRRGFLLCFAAAFVCGSLATLINFDHCVIYAGRYFIVAYDGNVFGCSWSVLGGQSWGQWGWWSQSSWPHASSRYSVSCLHYFPDRSPPGLIAPAQSTLLLVGFLVGWAARRSTDKFQSTAGKLILWVSLGYMIVVDIKSDICVFATTLALGLLAYLAQQGISAIRNRPRYPAGHCQSCGYNLTGNVSGLCSECGAPCPPVASAKDASR